MKIRPNPTKNPRWYSPIQGQTVCWRGFIKANSPEKTLLLGGNSVDIKIQADNIEACKQIGWVVNYTIHHSLQSSSSGSIWFSPDDLKTAFGLSEECDDSGGQTLVDLYGGDVAYLGRYIRAADFLNIPGPGHGFKGDANVSIQLTQTIKDAVVELMRKPE